MNEDYGVPPGLGGGMISKQYEAQMNAVQTAAYREPTIAERIEMAVKRAEQQLADAQRMKEIFQRNPDLEELINLMNKGKI